MIGEDFLPLPDSFEKVLTPENRVPLEFLPAHWLFIVLTNASRNEYAFTYGGELHVNWESSYIHHFSSTSTGIPPTCIQIECPNGQVIAVKITSMREKKVTPVQSSKPKTTKSPAPSSHFAQAARAEAAEQSTETPRKKLTLRLKRDG
jgi:hypothetical protein